MPWDVRLAKEARDAFQELTGKTADQVDRVISSLAENPFQGDVVALKGKEWQGRFRRRVGDYRIIFILNHERNEILISAILRRSEKTYR